jgi:hypothetical protein
VLFQEAPVGKSFRERAADKEKARRLAMELECTHVYAACDGEAEDNSRWRPCRHIRTKSEGEYIAINGDMINLPPDYILLAFPRCGTTAPKHRKRVHRLSKQEVDSLHHLGVPPSMDGEWPQARVPQYASYDGQAGPVSTTATTATRKRGKAKAQPYPRYVDYVPQAPADVHPGPHHEEDGRIHHPLDQPPLPAWTGAIKATPSLFINGVPHRRWHALKPAPAKKLTVPEMVAIIQHGDTKAKAPSPPPAPTLLALDVPARVVTTTPPSSH